MTIEQRAIYNKKENSLQRKRKERSIKAGAVVKSIRRHPELHDIFNHEGIRDTRQLPDAVQIDLASGSVTSEACLNFLFDSKAVLSAKAKRALYEIGRGRLIDNLVAKIWHPSAIGVRISSEPGDGSRMGNRRDAYKRLVFGRTQV